MLMVVAQIARTAEHSRTGKAIPKGVIAQFEAAEAKKDEEVEKVTPSAKKTLCLTSIWLPSSSVYVISPHFAPSVRKNYDHLPRDGRCD